MSRRIKSTYRPKESVYDQGYPRAVGPVVFQQPGDKQPEQEKPLTKSQDITPGQEKKDEGASSVQGSALEANQQELAQPKTGCGCGDGSDVKGKRLPNPEPIKEPEAGEGQPQVSMKINSPRFCGVKRLGLICQGMRVHVEKSSFVQVKAILDQSTASCFQNTCKSSPDQQRHLR
ncbi:X antigen family member 2-like [Physeter macrocephalus]|uniref:X antigen family member 2-like n=1 Tax=Physeter macrocephalus TaxID=9755 RepID=A0A2Y9T222_PHYMC|nr:X antigen family member 2-like [Physeter catodon]|eukprot:XP_023982895.1 X antigen family member 2-like [Physeter catodon]